MADPSDSSTWPFVRCADAFTEFKHSMFHPAVLGRVRPLIISQNKHKFREELEQMGNMFFQKAWAFLQAEGERTETPIAEVCAHVF